MRKSSNCIPSFKLTSQGIFNPRMKQDYHLDCSDIPSNAVTPLNSPSTPSSRTKFSTMMWGGVGSLQTLSNSSKKSFDSLYKLFQELYNIEHHAQKKRFQTISAKLFSNECSHATEQSGFHLMLNLEERLAVEEREFSRNLKSEFCDVIVQSRDKYASNSKTLLNDANRIEKELKDCLNRLEKAKLKHWKVMDEVNVLEDEIEKSTEQEAAEILRTQLLQKIEDSTKTNDQYVERIKAAREARKHGDQRMRQILDGLQMIEFLRLRKAKEIVCSYLERTQEKLEREKVFVEDTLVLFKETFQPEEDMLQYMNTHYTGLVPDPLPVFEVPNISIGKQQENVVSDSPVDPSWVLWFDCVLQLNDSDGLSLPIGDLDERLLTEGGRKAFAAALDQQRNVPDLLSETSFSCIIKAVWKCLDFINLNSADISPAKTIMMLSQTLFRVDEDGTRIYLHDQVKTHPIWLKPGFWDELMLTAISEEQIRGRIVISQRWMTDDEIFELQRRTNHVVFGLLGSFSHSMYMFELPKETIKDFVLKMAEISLLESDFTEQVLVSVEQNFLRGHE